MDKHEDLQKRFNIENYPHISLFVNGAQIKYNEVGYGVSRLEPGGPVHELHKEEGLRLCKGSNGLIRTGVRSAHEGSLAGNR